MMTLSITEARSSLADMIDQVRMEREPVYLTRRNTPMAVVVDVEHFEAMRKAEKTLAELSRDSSSSFEARETERLRRIAAMEKSAAPFAAWVKPGTAHPDSASDLYATRTVTS